MHIFLYIFNFQMTLIISFMCTSRSQYLRKVAEQQSANTTYFKYMQYMIVAFIFSPGYNSLSEAFQSYS